jgi:hypothetical protein
MRKDNLLYCKDILESAVTGFLKAASFWKGGSDNHTFMYLVPYGAYIYVGIAVL